jgi:hypothetical protein
MKRDDVFPSRWLKAADLAGKPALFTVATATFEALRGQDGTESKKMVLRFDNERKALVLNATNWDACAEILGDDTDDWIGGEVELYPTKTQMGGRTVDCIRVRRPGLVSRKKAASVVTAAEEAPPWDPEDPGAAA